MNEDCIPCSNCNQLIAESKMVLHETYCIRFNIKCERCGQFYDKNDPESHEEDYHKKEKCQYCNTEFDDISKHKCQKTPQQCLYCDLSYAKDAIFLHENQCGSRTEKCEICQTYIMKRDQNKHNQSCFQQNEKREKDIIRKQSIQELVKNFNDQINEVDQQQINKQKQGDINQLQQQVKIKKQVTQQQQFITRLPSKENNFGQIQGQKLQQQQQQQQAFSDNKIQQKVGLDQKLKNRPPSSNSLQGQRSNIKNNKPSTSLNRQKQQSVQNKSNQRLVQPSLQITKLEGKVENQFENKKQINKTKNSNLPPLSKQTQNPKRNLVKQEINQIARANSIQSREQAKRSIQNMADKEQFKIEGVNFSEKDIMQQKMIFEQLKYQKDNSNIKEQKLDSRQKVSIHPSEMESQESFEQFMSAEERALQQQIMDSYQLNSKKQ